MTGTTFGFKVVWLRSNLTFRSTARLSGVFGCSLLIFCFCVSLLQGCSTDASKEDDDEVNALLTVDLSRVDASVVEFIRRKQEAVAQNPEDSLLMGELAMTYEMNGFADSALTAYRLAFLLDSSDAKWPYFAALLAAGKGDFDEALKLIDSSLLIDASYAPAHIWRGRWALAIGEASAAAQAFNVALDLGATLPAKIGLAQIMMRQRESQAAFELLNELSLEFDDPYIRLLLFRVQQRLHLPMSPELAGISIQMARPPSPQDSRSQLKQQYEVSISASLEQYRRLIETESDSKSATQVIRQLFSKYPNDERVATTLLFDLRRTRDVAGLQAHQVTVRQKWPEHPVLNSILAEKAIEEGRLEDAKQHLDIALRSEPGNPSLLSQRGLIHIELANLEAATEDFLRSLEIENTANVRFFLGNVYAARSNWEIARCHLEQALELDSDFQAATEDLDRINQILSQNKVRTGDSLNPATCLPVSK